MRNLFADLAVGAALILPELVIAKDNLPSR